MGKRVESCDKAIEALFGLPDYSKAFIRNGMWYIPYKGVRLSRLEGKLRRERKKTENKDGKLFINSKEVEVGKIKQDGRGYNFIACPNCDTNLYIEGTWTMEFGHVIYYCRKCDEWIEKSIEWRGNIYCGGKVEEGDET